MATITNASKNQSVVHLQIPKNNEINMNKNITGVRLPNVWKRKEESLTHFCPSKSKSKFPHFIYKIICSFNISETD